MKHAIFTLLEELDAMLWEVGTNQEPRATNQAMAIWISGVVQAVLILEQQKASN